VSSERRVADALLPSLAVPVVAAPMFLVSGPELVIGACGAGVLGAFPALNARTPEELDEWLAAIGESLPARAAPYGVNLITHASNRRFESDLEVVVRRCAPVIVASVGSPVRVVERVHAYGGLVLADVGAVAHARKAIDAGVDGLILLSAGAGGNTGSLNPFAFLEEVRGFYHGLIAVAGGITNGRQVRALELAGADLAYVGTPFIAAEESLASEAYRQAVLEGFAADVVCTTQVSGIPANILRQSLDGLELPEATSGAPGDMDPAHKPWLKRVWGAGHGVGAVKAVEPVASICERFGREYETARRGDPVHVR
jgi:nitronate monooxygenase